MGETISPEKKILNDAFITWFNSRYKEIIATELLARWQMVDTFVQMGIALTAAGSAVAGWQLWDRPDMKIVWAAISGIVSLMAIGHKGFRVVDQVKVWSDTKQTFTMLRNQLETLRYEIKTSFGENSDSINRKYLEIREVFTGEDQRTPKRDLWLTRSLEQKTISKVYNSVQLTNFEEELNLSRNKYQSDMKEGE